MKEKLLKVKLQLNAADKKVLAKEDLEFITGGTAMLSGSGTSSTSGSTCCDATCYCKPIIPFKAQ